MSAPFKDIASLIRPSLRNFKPYSSGWGETKEGRVFLHANELSSGSPVRLGGRFESLELNRYPDPDQSELRTELGKRFGVAKDRVFVGVGSDEVIDLLIRLTCEPSRDSILQIEPTYGVYQVQADLNAVKMTSVALKDDFSIDLPRTLKAITPQTKLAFLCSPNNPTGNLLDTQAILAICDAMPGLVVIDQAYAEFAGAAGDTLIPELAKRRNLVILRTLSKAWGLAGARLGYCIADAELVSWLLRIKAPYNVSVPTTAIALAALAQPQFLEREVTRVANERVRLVESLKSLHCVTRVYPSDSNFVLARYRDRDRAFHALFEHGIVVRRRNEPGLRDCLRITVGTRGENEQILEILKKLNGHHPPPVGGTHA